MKILVMSCDKNTDLFNPFHYCIEKYWPDHPEVFYSTETLNNKYYKTICKNYPIEKWTKRIRESIQEINDEYIMIMVDDIFFQQPVNNELVLGLTKYFSENTASLNLQPTFDKLDIPFKDDILKRSENGKFKTSVMCSLWKKDKLLHCLDYDTNPWQFEWDNKHYDYEYLVCNDNNYLNWGFSKKQWRFGLHEGKWFKQCIDFFNKENYYIDYSKRGCLNMKKCFGIISYFPWDQPQRKQRQDRLDKLIKQLSDLWPDIPIIVIAQQWKLYNWDNKCKNKVLRYDYPALGILKARQELRERFLQSEFDYLIMFDDDAIIQYHKYTDVIEYVSEIDKHPNGFAFVKGGNNKYCPYADSQLNLCAISRFIYEKEPIPNIDAQKSEGFEDRIWSTLLHNKYPQYEFDLPLGIKCCHFKNPNINQFGGEVPSTWAKAGVYNWRNMRDKTLEIEKYIVENKELPKCLK